MKTLTVKLKQHTPLIHFQHEQYGATLRASEVKPKLDRFILAKLSDDERREGERAGWIKRKNDKVWLDYKMRIEAEENPNEYLICSLFSSGEILDAKGDNIKKLPFKILKNTPYFAQENVNSRKEDNDSNPVFIKGKNSNNQNTYIYNEEAWNSIGKKGLMWNGVKVIVCSMFPAIIEKIKKYLSEFFICNNFGTRSTKGFGSFTIADSSADIDSVLKNNFQFVYKKDVSKLDMNGIFSDIKKNYQILKSGNNNKSYTKSLLFCYAANEMENNPRWEKRFFKRAVEGKLPKGYRLLNKNKAPICDSRGNQSWKDKDRYDYKYVRAMLGVADKYEFLLEKDCGENGWKRDNKNKLIVKPRINGVDRCESPILIKVLDGAMYLVGNDVNQGVLNKDVNITYSINENSLKVSEDFKRIKTPDDVFSLKNFMDYAMKDKSVVGFTKIK